MEQCSSEYYSKYYNKDSLNLIVSKSKEDPYRALKWFEQYLEKFPNDYNATCLYIGVLISLQEFSLAEDILNSLEETLLSDRHYISRNKNIDLKFRDLLFCKVKILCYTGRYNDVFNMLKDKNNKSYFKELGLLYLLDIYCRKKLNFNLDLNYIDDSYYLYRQIVNYNYNLMLEHVKRHIEGYTPSDDDPVTSFFSPDFPLEMMISTFLNNFSGYKKMCYGVVDDTYFFKFDNCGKVNSRPTDFFKIVCLNNSSDIITMCPVEYGASLPFTDVNYLVKKDEYSNVACNRAARFYKRFNINP